MRGLDAQLRRDRAELPESAREFRSVLPTTPPTEDLMDRDDYARLRRNPRLREALLSATGTRPPTRSQLEADLADAGVPDDLIPEVVDDAARIALDVQRGAKPFHIRGMADQTALAWLDKLDKRDSLTGVLPDRDDDADTIGEQGAAEALARQREGVHGNPSLKQSSPASVPWQQGR